MLIYFQKSFQFHPTGGPLIWVIFYWTHPVVVCVCIVHIRICIDVFIFVLNDPLFLALQEALCSSYVFPVLRIQQEYCIILGGNAIRNQYLAKDMLFSKGCYCF